jgi:hypothetical protein
MMFTKPDYKSKAHASCSPQTDKTIQHALPPGMLEVDFEFVAFDDGDGAVAEFAVEDAWVALGSLLEQVRVRARSLENDASTLPSLVVDLVDQQEIAADVAFAMAGPFAFERVVKPFGTERRVVGDEDEYRLLEAMHVVATRPRQSFIVFLESLRVIAGSRKRRAPGRGFSHQGWRSIRLRFRTGPCAQ